MALSAPQLPARHQRKRAPERLSEARLVVAKSPYFVLEQLDLAANSYWEIDADREVWMLLLEGERRHSTCCTPCRAKRCSSRISASGCVPAPAR